MASLLERIRDLLLADPAIQGQVGTRIYANEMPRGSTVPSILLAERERQHEYSFGGKIDIDFADLTVTPIDLVRTTAVNLGADVRRVMDYYADNIAIGGLHILRIWFTQESTELQTPTDGSEMGYWLLDQQYLVAFKET